MRLQGPILAVSATFVFFGLCEGALRLARFHYSRTPGEMQRQVRDDFVAWQNRAIVVQHFEPHPRRMWTAKPGYGLVNMAGYQGELLPVQKTNGKSRILFLGDSCTNAGPEGYPERTIARLASAGIGAEALVAGVGGYTTFQGLDFFRELLPYGPDVVVAYFGWNDHWLALGGQPDDAFRTPPPLVASLQRSLSRLRTYQALHYLLLPPARRIGSLDEMDVKSYSGRFRVPLPQYRHHVGTMADLARERGVPIYFIAAPIGPHVTQNRLEPLAETRHILRLHAAYVETLRAEVWRREGARLVDFSDITFDRDLMGGDGIHPLPAGNDRIAERLAAAIAAGAH